MSKQISEFINEINKRITFIPDDILIFISPIHYYSINFNQLPQDKVQKNKVPKASKCPSAALKRDLYVKPIHVLARSDDKCKYFNLIQLNEMFNDDISIIVDDNKYEHHERDMQCIVFKNNDYNIYRLYLTN